MLLLKSGNLYGKANRLCKMIPFLRLGELKKIEYEGYQIAIAGAGPSAIFAAPTLTMDGVKEIGIFDHEIEYLARAI